MHHSFNAGNVPPGDGTPAPQIPDHSMLRCIGRGSYGEVWLAKNVFGVYRAVKVVYARSFATTVPFKREFNGIKRFEPVSRSHDGFVDILQAGQNEEAGYFYYVMELADDVETGQQVNPDTYSPKSLSSEQGKRQRFSVSECVELGSAIASALWHLHQNKLVHRDIKPSNIIFVHGRPKLADIGLVADQAEAKSHVGTEGFIPPEGQGRPQADIFSLGKVLYEMAMGLDRNHYPELPPNWGQTADQAQLLELNEVITQACEPEVTLRYASAEEMLRELNVIGGGGSVRRLRILERRWELFKKWGAVAALLVVIGLSGFFLGYRDYKKKEEARLQKVRSLVSYGCRIMENGDLFGALSWFAEALRLNEKDPVAARVDRVRIAAVTRECPKLVDFWLQQALGHFACFSRDGKYLAVCDGGGITEVYELGNAQPIGKPFRIAPGEEESHTVAFSPDDSTLLTAGSTNLVERWDWRTGQKSGKDLVHAAQVNSAAYSPDGKKIVTACLNSEAYIWDAESGKVLWVLAGHGEKVEHAVFSHDGLRVVTSSRDNLAIIWDAETGEMLHRLRHDRWVYHAVFSPDDQMIVTASYDKTAQIWNANTGLPCYKPLEHMVGVPFVDFSPDGRYLVTAGFDTVAKVWDLKEGRFANPPLDHPAQVTFAGFSPDNRLLVTLCVDRTVRIWSLEGNGWLPPTAPGVFSPNGDRRAVIGNNVVSIIREESTNAVTIKTGGQANEVYWNQTGNHLLTISRAPKEDARRLLECWAATNGAKVASMPIEEHPQATWELSTDGLHAISWKDQWVGGWDLRAGRTNFSFSNSGKVESAKLSPNGEYFVVIDDTNATIRSSKTGAVISGPLAHEAAVCSAEFSPDNRLLLTSCTDGGLAPRYAQVWNVSSGKPVNGPMWHKDGLYWATFSPNGKLIATSGQDCMARIWDATTGLEVCPPLHHSEHIKQVRFSEDSRWVVTASMDKTAKVWDANTGESVTPPFQHPEPVLEAAFVRNGNAIRAQTKSGATFVWDLLPDQRSVAAILTAAEFLSGKTISGTNSLFVEQSDLVNRLKQFRTSGENQQSLGTNRMLWHENQAMAAEMGNQPFAARFHLDLLLQAQPDNARLLAYHGSANAGLGKWQEAEADFVGSFARSPATVQALGRYARVCLALNRTNEYYKTCDQLRSLRSLAAPSEISMAIQTLCLLPQPDFGEIALLEKKQLTLSRDELVLGALEFRRGNFAKAEKLLRLKRETPSADGNDTFRLIFGTMNYLQLKKPKEAAEAFHRADAWVTVAIQRRTFEAKGEVLSWERRFDLQFLRAQAAAAIAPDAGPDKDPFVSEGEEGQR